MSGGTHTPQPPSPRGKAKGAFTTLSANRTGEHERRPHTISNEERDAALGRPSYVWGFGQERRFRLILPHLSPRPQPMLDLGCGIGVYLRRFRQERIASFGVDLERHHLRQAAGGGLPVGVARSEALPFADATFGTVLLHEVLEHFEDDAVAIREAVRVTRPGGRLFIFVPNRLYPFETHGIYVGSRYLFGNVPLVGYLPNRWRRQLCPHVRAYTTSQLRRLLAPLPCRILLHVQIYPGYDKIFRHWPFVARMVRELTYRLESTPARAFGLSHFLVAEKIAAE